MNSRFCKRLQHPAHPDLQVLLSEIRRIQKQNRQLRAGSLEEESISQQPMSHGRSRAIIRLAYSDHPEIRAAGERLVQELDRLERENSRLVLNRFSVS